MAFQTILVAPGLSPLQQRTAVLSGPPGVFARRDYQTLLRAAAGFSSVEEIDLTSEYRHTLRSWLAEASAREAQLRVVLGDAAFEDRRKDRSLQASAVENGLLRRSLFVVS